MAAIGIFPGVFRDVAHKRIHSEAAGHHCRTHCQTSHILTVFGSGKDSASRLMIWWDQDMGQEVDEPR